MARIFSLGTVLSFYRYVKLQCQFAHHQSEHPSSRETNIRLRCAACYLSRRFSYRLSLSLSLYSARISCISCFRHSATPRAITQRDRTTTYYTTLLARQCVLLTYVLGLSYYTIRARVFDADADFPNFMFARLRSPFSLALGLTFFSRVWMLGMRIV